MEYHYYGMVELEQGSRSRVGCVGWSSGFIVVNPMEKNMKYGMDIALT